MAIELSTRFTPPRAIELPDLNYGELFSRAETAWEQLAKVPVWMGQETLEFGQIFRAKVVGDEPTLVFQGATGKLNRVAAGLTQGSVRVLGDVGDYAARGMRAGRLEILGNAGDWLGAELSGGDLIVQGQCGRMAVASLPGKRRGITGGMVQIYGSAGAGIGRRMRRGFVFVGGDCIAPAGEMLAGTFVMGGKVSGGLGTLMKRGTLICLQPIAPSQLGGFSKGIVSQPTAWRLLHTALHQQIATGQWPDVDTCFQTYHGDMTTGARGEAWVVADGR